MEKVLTILELNNDKNGIPMLEVVVFAQLKSPLQVDGGPSEYGNGSGEWGESKQRINYNWGSKKVFKKANLPTVMA